jgi:hypothetical protein
MLLIALAILALIWLATTVVVVGLCASAAAGDRALARQTFPPRKTWRPVRSSSFTSCHSDQLAT